MSNEPPPITADELFFRYIWSPTDYVDGVYQTSTIPSDDLMGDGQRGCSVDRASMIVREYADALIRQLQAKKAEQNIPMLAPIANPDLQRISNEQGQPELEVRPDPRPAEHGLPTNPAHAQIHSVNPRKRSEAKRLRFRLLQIMTPPRSVGDVFHTQED